MENIIIRKVNQNDIPFLWEMLFESVFTTEEIREELKANEEKQLGLKKYLGNWGRIGDIGFVAEDDNGNKFGAAWCRLFSKSERGQGILAIENVPELAISIEKSHRGKGLGSKLMISLIEKVKDTNYKSLMLSVDPENTNAVELYKKLGFLVLDTDDEARGTSLIMKLDL